MAAKNSNWIATVTLFISVFIGPAVVHYILHHLGEPSLICSCPEHCKPKMLLFFVTGFVLTWAIYWAVRLITHLINPPRNETESQNSPPGNPDSV